MSGVEPRQDTGAPRPTVPVVETRKPLTGLGDDIISIPSMNDPWCGRD